jgi:RNA polymerase sigma factor (sigma-70 family)
MTVDINFFSANELGDRCAEEASKKDPKRRDDRFCYELVKRAFGLEDGEALNRTYSIYVKIWSKSWIRNPQQFDSQSYTAEDFIHMAFFKVYTEIKGSRFASFPLLNPFLSYLHTTLVRLVAEYLRRQKGRQELNTSNTDEALPDWFENFPSIYDLSNDVEKRDIMRQIRERIYVLLPAEKDQQLLKCRAEGMTRAEIVAAYPEWWPDENAVRVDWQRICRKLGNDPGLRGLGNDLL